MPAAPPSTSPSATALTIGTRCAPSPRKSSRRSRRGRAMPRRSVTLRAVTTLFLERQHLARPHARALTAGRLRRFAEDVGGIQLDSINVLERAHYLTIWSRFGP